MKNSHTRVYDLLFVLVLLVAACFRLVGLNWDQGQHLHPDERFMTMVEGGMQPVGTSADQLGQPPTAASQTWRQKYADSLHDCTKWGGYFDTACSPLNPNNVGYPYYVYGDLPILIVRYAAVWMNSVSAASARFAQAFGSAGVGQVFATLAQTSNWAGYDQVALLGRVLSGLADLGTIFLIYLIAARIYGRKVALLTAAFAAVAVMEIQQSHFFTVDNFANFFMFLTAYFAVEIGFGQAGTESWETSGVEQLSEAAAPSAVEPLPIPATPVMDAETAGAAPAAPSVEDAGNTNSAAQDFIPVALRSALFWNVVGFGVVLGMSVASKLTAAPLAILLPGALALRYYRQRQAGDPHEAVDENPPAAVEPSAQPAGSLRRTPAQLSIEYATILLVLGAFLSLVSFRVFQPYAFNGPGLLNVGLNQSWVDNIKQQQQQAAGDDSPPALQWARRSRLFSLQNIVEWGLGWPLGILACLGFLYMGWRILRGEKEHILLWGWTGLYFAWQSLQPNPTMRYQLPIYPFLAMMAAWLALRAFERKTTDHGPQTTDDGLQTIDGNPVFEALKRGLSSVVRALTYVMPVIGVLVLLATGAWAFAFIHIYTVDQPRVQATRWIYQNVPGPFDIQITQPDGKPYNQPMPYQATVITPPSPYDVQFTAQASGTAQGILLGHAADPAGTGTQTLSIALASQPGGFADPNSAHSSLTANFAPTADPRGASYTLKFDHPVAVVKGKDYFLHFETTGALTLAGSAPINESDWDDGLPLRMDGYDAFGGIYDGSHNFEMYWDDNADKLDRFTSNLDTGDYIFISSNRQWATTTRVPERYPLTSVFYRDLVGCPADKDIIWCYSEATPGMFKGSLGFDLVKVFESFPTIGPWQINDQFAEEAFTVYDHPKVLIFQKRADYNSAQVHTLLGAVDLSKVVHLTPQQAGSYTAKDLMLPAVQLKAQLAGGTWSDMFSYDSLQNKYPLLGLLIWYVAIGLLGLFTYLFLRLLLPGLSDRGYPLARISGLLLLAYFAWIVGSLGGTYSRLTIAIGVALIVFGGLAAGWFKRGELLQEIRSRGKYFLTIEGIFMLFFLIDLFIRIGNPDLWHPSKGGERPMDFSYLNAVLKSTSFPPYDPWFAGGYINYYYWGYVLVGTPIKLLGIVPTIAYNLVLPTLFAMLALGGFSVAWNLAEGARLKTTTIDDPGTDPPGLPEADAPPTPIDQSADQPVTRLSVRENFINLQWFSGIAAGVGLVLVGNLGTVRIIYQALQQMVVTNDQFNSPDPGIPQRLGWAIQGIGKLFTGQQLPIGVGNWYWDPSRVIPSGPGNEITEFPLFTFLYSDLHAHMLALPLTVLAIAWALSVLMARNMSRWTWLGTLVFGGIIIGSLRPTNTWDLPTYLLLGGFVTGYAIVRYADVGETPLFGLDPWLQRVLLALVGIGLLAGFSVLFYQPFAYWYALAYNSFIVWDGPKTPIWSYWTHWGLFLFVIITWLVWETRQWMAQTPLSSLAKLKPYAWLIVLVLVLMFAAIGVLMYLKVEIAWFAMPLAFWALILILRPGQTDLKRLVLFMMMTGLAISLFVEVFVLDGDIGRQNTIFKFYMQVWVLFAVSSAAAVGWLVSEMHEWSDGWRSFWVVTGSLLLAGAFLYTITASWDKITDRMASGVPLTLDSMTYMQYATYGQNDKTLDLGHDYLAIRWMQNNVKGSPVIVEANSLDLYRWFTRFTIYTGLPDVVGWDWHQRQQRSILPGDLVTNRVNATIDFYNTTDTDAARAFLKQYNAQYIVVGQLERAAYNPDGLAKFPMYDGKYWKTVYSEDDTVIYQVQP